MPRRFAAKEGDGDRAESEANGDRGVERRQRSGEHVGGGAWSAGLATA